MILGVEKFTRKMRSSRIREVVEKINVRVESCLNNEPSVRLLLETLESETYTFKERISIGIDRNVRKDTPITMDPPPILSTHPLIHWLG